jgi:hypothetical protein
VFFAAGGRGVYELSAHAGSDAWTVTVDHETPQQFPTLDDALEHIVTVREHATA